jgi:hypothetical protein
MRELHSHDLRQAFAAATHCLERYRDAINLLNVFPVPDGDTGTNMLLTQRSAMESGDLSSATSVGEVAARVADGAFWGARGNSGVILSQFFKGFAEGVRGKETCGGADLVRAFNLANEAAFKAVGHPVEGTMLTVIRALARAAQEDLARGEDDPRCLWRTAFLASQDALALTPSQLPVLREAGVVDAGGMGIVVIIGGALGYLAGRKADELDLGIEGHLHAPLTPAKGRQIDRHYLDATETALWGYCTQFLIEGHPSAEGLDLELIRQRFTQMADSVVVVGDDRYVRVHIHAADPGPALTYGGSLGQLSQIKIDNMSQQNREFVAEHRSREEIPPGPSAAGGQRGVGGISVVAVATGPGLARLFQENGAAQVVDGGQTMNPSVRQLLDAAEASGAGPVILLPNNENIVAAAGQAAAGANSRIHLVPSRTVPQGVAALLAFNPEESLERNLRAMREAVASVVTIEVTRAMRSTAIGGVRVSAGHYLGLRDGQLSATGETPEKALKTALAQVGLSKDQVVTLYRGADSQQEEAEAVRRQLEEETPGIQVDLVFGGQPHYPYLASVE